MGEAASLPTVERRPGAALRMLILLGRLALGGMFLYAAYSKLRQPWMLFAFSVNSYQLLSEWAVVAVARTVPWLELGLGLLLIAGYGLRYAAAGASALLLLWPRRETGCEHARTRWLSGSTFCGVGCARVPHPQGHRENRSRPDEGSSTLTLQEPSTRAGGSPDGNGVTREQPGPS